MIAPAPTSAGVTQSPFSRHAREDTVERGVFDDRLQPFEQYERKGEGRQEHPRRDRDRAERPTHDISRR